jgi:hypothetical protein
MGTQHVLRHASPWTWTRSMYWDMQHWHVFTACTFPCYMSKFVSCCIVMSMRECLCPCSLRKCCIFKSMQHGLGHAAWTWTCSIDTERSMDLNMQLWHGKAAWTWTCSIDMDMQHGHEQAAWTWTGSMDMDRQHGMDSQHWHWHLAWTWTCSVDMDMQRGHGHATQTWTFSMDMDIQLGNDTQFGIRMSMLHVHVHASCPLPAACRFLWLSWWNFGEISLSCHFVSTKLARRICGRILTKFYQK